MSITKVWIEEGCIVCRACEELCPEVFDVKDEGCEVRPGQDLALREEGIRQGAAVCPVQVIQFEVAKP